MTIIEDWPRFVRMVFRSSVRWGVGLYSFFLITSLIDDSRPPGWTAALICVGAGIAAGCARWFAEQANAPLHKP